MGGVRACVCVSISVDTVCHSVPMKVKGQLSGVGSLFSLWAFGIKIRLSGLGN